MMKPTVRVAMPLALALGLSAASVPRLAAQERLIGRGAATVGAMVESWRFPGGIHQPTSDGADSVQVLRATQLSIPFAASLMLGDRWSAEIAGAYTSGDVSLANGDPTLGVRGYRVSGTTDVRVRATGRLIGDNVVLTLGANLPTGATSHSAEAFSALRVLAAPALSFQTPVLGSGTGMTAGVVLAREMGGWGWAVGAAYEARSSYTPAALAPDFRPGNVLHLSLGTDGLIGQHGVSVGVSADFHAHDRAALDAGGVGGSSGGAGVAIGQNAVRTRLGPIITTDVQLRIAAPRFRELTLYVVDRYRSRYTRDDLAIDGSSGNYLDAGVRAVIPASRATGVLAALNVRHHTGLPVDDALSTAAMASGALTVGIIRELSGGYSLQPFVRGQVGRIRTGLHSVTANALAVGVTLGARF
jgi:hypothetical protein